MAFEFSYGGQPLHVDVYGEAAAWINSHVSLADLFETMMPQPQFSRSTCISQPAHGWPERPALKVGQWFYPWGLSRWGSFTTIVDRNWLDELESDSAAELKIANEDWEFATEMHMLSPRPLSSFGGSANDLFLVSFVDSRYFLPMVPLGNLGTSGTSWHDCYQGVSSAMGTGNFGVLSHDTISADYLTVSGASDLNGRGSPVNLWGDAVAFNVGQRIVRRLNGSYSAQGFALSEETYQANLDYHAGKLRAGGEIELNATAFPATVRVDFPRAYGKLLAGCHFSRLPQPYNTGEWYSKSVSVSDYDVSGQSGTIHVIQDTAVAQFDWDEADDAETPSNQEELDALAEKITEDFVGWRKHACDLVSNDLTWTPEGHTDLLIDFNQENVALRARTAPFNFCVREMGHYTSAAKGKIGHFTGRASEDIEHDLAGEVRLTDAGTEPDGYKAKVYNPFTTTIEEDAEIMFSWNSLVCRFEVIAEDCS